MKILIDILFAILSIHPRHRVVHGMRLGNQPSWIFSFFLIFCGSIVPIAFSQTAAASTAFTAPEVNIFMSPENHLSIGVKNESLIKIDGFVPFSRLMSWDFQSEASGTPLPQNISDLDKKRVALIGFMFPLQEGDAIKTFMLMNSTQTCCYGPCPQINQYVLVESTHELAFERYKPVLVKGTFFVEPRPQDGYIFRMECDSLDVPTDPSINRQTTDDSHNNPSNFNWQWLQDLARSDPEEIDLERLSIPASLSAYLGKQIRLEGNLIRERNDTQSTSLVLACYPWDGCCMGIPPNNFTSMQLSMASGSPIPATWMKSGVLDGILEPVPPGNRREQGLLRLRDVTFLSLNEKTVGEGISKRNVTPPLIKATEREDSAQIRLFIRAGANVNDRDKSGKTALHTSAGMGNRECSEALINGGADIQGKCLNNQTPLHEAAKSGMNDIITLLASHGADLNAVDKAGFTPLAWSVTNGCATASNLLIALGADINIPNAMKVLPIQLAVMSSQYEIIQVLAAKGADINCRNASGKTLIGIATERRDKEMIRILRSLGAKD